MHDMQETVNIKDSLLQEQQPNIAIRCLKTIDIFAFIPVPKDDNVSTKQSLIGTVVFFSLFLIYVIYDLVQFITHNPPMIQTYKSAIDAKRYPLPQVAIGFMSGQNLNQTDLYDEYFTYKWTRQSRKAGQERPATSLDYAIVNNKNKSNANMIDWINQQTKKVFSVLRTNTQPAFAKGLLYVSDQSQFSRIKMYLCNYNNVTQNCQTEVEVKNMSAKGRIFLFIQNEPDNTTVSQEGQGFQNGNKFLMYNFFITPGTYKRVNLNFEVVKTLIQPDWFHRFFEEESTRVRLNQVVQQTSNVTINPGAQFDAIAFNFQLSPMITNTRVYYDTSIDRLSSWGAFWGVLFAIFAIIFLNYNKRKFYKKNPDWSRFKKDHVNESEAEYQDEQKQN